jgi:tetratricopeptide (TPR) repeat protein
VDLITKSIVTVLNAGVIGDTAESNQNLAAVKAYKTLKQVLSRKFGASSDLLDAIERLEKKPVSAGRQEVLMEEIAAVKADRDLELLAITQTLLDGLQAKPGLKPVIPLQRPARINHFAGREVELDHLLTSLQPGQVVALYGPGGVGKSALAAAAIWKIAPRNDPPPDFPDGIVYHNFYNQPRVDIALAKIARAFGQDPMPTAYDAAEGVLSDRQALLVLDGVEQADDLPGLLAIHGKCGVLITSRYPQDGVTIQQDVPPLPASHALDLLRTWSEAKSVDRAAGQRLCELLGRSPLAICLAGRYLATKPEKIIEYLDWLEQTDLANLELGQRQEESIPRLIEHSLAQVSETARQALGVVGLLALSPFDEYAVIKALMAESPHGLLSTLKGIFNKQKSEERQLNMASALTELANYGLLWWTGHQAEVSHPLVHTYARQHLSPPPEVVKRLAAYYTTLAWDQTALGPEGYARLDTDRLHFMNVLNESLERGNWEAAHGLAAAIEDYLDRQGYWIERVIANEAGLVAAWQLGRPSEGAWLGNLGDTYRTMGHAKWAIEHFKKALDTAYQAGDPYSEGNSLGNLGLAYRDLGQIDQARQYLKQSLAIFERINSPSSELVRDWLLELEDAQE